VAMAEFSWKERGVKVALGRALFCGWWYFASDYSKFLSTPLSQLTIEDITGHVAWLLLLVPWLYATISWLYENWTGRDSVWLWRPD
jgi:hypothetical protein